MGGLYAVDGLPVAPVSQDLVWLDSGPRAALAAGGRVWLLAPSGHADRHAALASRLGSEGVPVQLSGPTDLGGVGFSQLSRPREAGSCR